MKTASILQTFSDISWHICMTDMGPKGLWVGPVELLRNPGDGWRPILYQAGLADIFVPYHNSPAARYYDLGGGASRALAPISQLDTGPAGFPIWLSNESFPTVAGEVRDRGIGWLCKGDTQEVRRARELVLWAVSDAGNYDNIIEFSFRDDGSIGFRTGNTGYNSPGSPVESHSHDSLWYVDMDLNGFPGDTASMLNHSEPYTANQLLAADQQVPIAVEGARQFQAAPFELVSLLIEDNATQVFGQKLGYEFLPHQSLPTRHFGWQETWTQNDIYIARYRYSDTLWASPIANHQAPDLYLLPALNNEPVVGQDLVAWIKTAAHHAPTTEDWATPTFIGLLGGVTLTHWSGFRIEPHNLFPTNPLGAPARCGS
jgi:Cu2+-containing amine oxidase